MNPLKVRGEQQKYQRRYYLASLNKLTEIMKFLACGSALHLPPTTANRTARIVKKLFAADAIMPPK
jgi:hypothetical protein